MGVGAVSEQQELAALQQQACWEPSAIPRQVKAVTSPTGSQDVGQQAPRLGWGQWSGSDTVQWSPRRATAPKHVQAKPGRQVSESRSGPDSRRCKTVQTELLHGCTVPQATASAKPRLKSGSEGKGEAGPRY